MLSLVELKKYYVKLYSEIRNYLWDFNTVECLAELEVAVYRQFPEIAEVRSKFNRLYSCIADVTREDEYLAEAVDNFRDVINSSDTFFSRILKLKEA